MSANDPRNDDSPWTRPSVIGSGVFLLLLAIAAVVILILPNGAHNHHHAPAAQAPTTTATTTTSAPKGTVKTPTKGPCTLPPGNQTVPSSAPPQGTTWQTVNAMVAPQAATTYGPQHTRDGFNVCYAHSPDGALVAVLNFYAASSTTPPARLFKYLAVDVPSQIKDKSELDDGAGNVEIAGYRYGLYSPGHASITVVLQYPNSAYEAVLTSLEWVGGDWKVVYPSGGIAPHSQITSLRGYVQWKDF